MLCSGSECRTSCWDYWCTYMLTHARSYFGCSFKIQKQKETTGRVVVWREFNVLNRYRPSGPQ